MKDILGREIKIGDYIVYATRSGDTAKMGLGKVRDIRPSQSVYDHDLHAYRKEDSLFLDTVSSSSWGLGGWAKNHTKSKAKVDFGHRVCIVSVFDVPAEIIQLLNS
jgi:hypothetical protein